MLVRLDEELAKYLLTYFVQFLVSKLVDSFSFFFQVNDRKDESWVGDDVRVVVSVYPSFHSIGELAIVIESLIVVVVEESKISCHSLPFFMG